MRLGLRHSSDARFFPIPGERAVMGCGPGARIVLDDDGVAPQHAAIAVTTVGIELDDLAGNARTLVNGYSNAKHFLSRGDRVVLGSAALVLEITEGEDAAPTRCPRCSCEVPVAGTPCAVCAKKTPVPRSRTPAPNEAPRAVASTKTTIKVERPVEPTPDLPPDWEPIGILGEGSQGRVYKVRHRGDGSLAAAKTLWGGGPKAVGRFEREIEALRILDHPAIVALRDVWRTDEKAVLIMELVQGPGLGSLVKRHGRLEPVRALRIGARIADGLAYAGKRGVTHRDVKPSNILIAPQDSPKLTDFGLVAFDETRTRLTAEGQWIGTPFYMAPEQVNGKNVDGRTDVWGLGATLYQAITGRLPFEGHGPTELFKNILRTPIDVAKLTEIAGEPAARLIDCFLAKSIDDRPTPDEAAREIQELLG